MMSPTRTPTSSYPYPTSSASNPDPYPQFAAELATFLETTRQSFTSYLRIRSLAAASSPELSSATEELIDNLDQLGEDLSDLTATVTAVERDPYRFGLDVADVRERRRFVTEVRGELDDMHEEMRKDPGPAAGSSSVTAGASSYGGFIGDDDDGSDDPVARFEQEQQLEIMRRQDEQLEGVSRTVGNLRSVAGALGQELSEQEEMVDALDQDVERVDGKLKKGMKDLNQFIRKNEDSVSNWCIGLLVLVLVMLLFIALII